MSRADAIDRKIAAIRAKDVQKILAERPYIWSLGGNSYTANDLRAWGQKLINTLQQIRDADDLTVQGLRTTVKNRLTANDLAIVQSCEAGEPFDLTLCDNPDDVSIVMLIIFWVQSA